MLTRKNVVDKIAVTMRHFFPDVQTILYGSEARCESHAGSDIDVLIIVPECKSFTTTKVAIAEKMYDIELESGVNISPLVMLKSMWDNLRTPFALNVKRDGLPL